MCNEHISKPWNPVILFHVGWQWRGEMNSSVVLMCHPVEEKFDWLIDWTDFYAVLAIFQPCNGGCRKKTPIDYMYYMYFCSQKIINYDGSILHLTMYMQDKIC